MVKKNKEQKMDKGWYGTHFISHADFCMVYII